MVRPPALVHVRDLDGSLRAALLLALRDGRCFVQVSRGAGDSVLRWLPSTRLVPADADVVRDTYAHPEVHEAAVSWRAPRSRR